MRILIAEDDPKLLKSLVHIFELNNYAIDGVDNGVDAFDFASSDEYDGLVLDIMMPGMDGVTLLKRLRANGITTPALFLTARTEIDQRIEGLDAGADDYLPKPFSMSLLLAGIAAISLLVGGIGIMNIMLVSVTERTKEIGIRKAVGAKRRYIMLQFLCEACVLFVLGGIIGLGFSFAGVQIYNLIAGASTPMNWAVGGIAIAFCAVIGIVFGGYPAAKASRLQPIDALHNS